MRGRLTEKADVFSFGVVALELVSGRPNSDSSLEEDKIYLLDWVCMLLLFQLLLYIQVNILIRTCLTISSHSHTTQQNDLTMSLLYISINTKSYFSVYCVADSPTLQPKMSLHEITFYTILCKCFDKLIIKVLHHFSRTFFFY